MSGKISLSRIALIESRRQDISAAQAEIERQDKIISGYQNTIEAGDAIEAGYQQLVAARESQSMIADQLAQRQDVNQQIYRLEKALAEQRAQIKRQAEVVRERISGLENLRNAANDTDFKSLQAEVRVLEDLDIQRNKSTKALQKLDIRRSRSLTKMDTLKADGIDLNERMQRLQLADGATCPLCGQALTASHRDQMLAQLEAERDELREQYLSCGTEIREIDAKRQVKGTRTGRMGAAVKKSSCASTTAWRSRRAEPQRRRS